MEVYIKNFRSIEDFNYSLNNGITLIKGVSGKGKTTILEAIRWCIYGNIKNVYPFGEKKPSNNFTQVRIIFKNMEIIRTKPPEMLKVILDDSELIKTEAEKYLEDNIGKKNLWQACCYISQGERNILMNLTNNEKMELIKEIVFSHEEEKIDYYNKHIHTYLSQLEDNIKTQEGKISYSDNIVEELRKEDIEGVYLLYKEKIKDYENLNYLTNMKKNIYDQKLQNEKTIYKNKILEQKEKIYQESVKILANYPFELTFDLIEKWKKYVSSSKYLEENNNIEEVKENIEELIKIKNIILENQKIPNLEKKQLLRQIQHIKQYNKYIEDKEKLINLNKKKKRIFTEIEKIENYLIEKYDHCNIEKFKNILDNSIENKLSCPQCKQSLVLEKGKLVRTDGIELHKKDKIIIADNVKKHDLLYNIISDIESDISIIEIDEVDKPSSLDLEEKEKNLKLLEKYIPVEYSLEKINQKIKNRKQYEKYKEQEQIKKDNFMKEFLEINYPDNISNYYNQYLINTKNIEDYNQYIIKNDKNYNEVKTLDFFNNRLFLIEEKINDITYFNNLKQRYKGWVKINKEREKLKNDLAVYNKEKESCNKIKNLIVQATNETLENLLTQLNNDISEIINEFFENAQLKISMFKKVKNQFKPHFSFTVSINNNIYDNINNLSGGEKDRFSIALTLALNKHFNFPFIMLDECMSSLDQENRKKCLEIIKKHAGDKIIVNICHETIEGYYDNIVNI